MFLTLVYIDLTIANFMLFLTCWRPTKTTKLATIRKVKLNLIHYVNELIVLLVFTITKYYPINTAYS